MSTQDGSLVKVARFLETYGARVAHGILLLILSILGLTFSLRYLSGIELIIWVIVIIAIALAAAFFLVLSIRSEDKRSTDIKDLREKVENAETRVGDLEDTVGVFSEQYTVLFKGLLAILANQVLNYGPNERVSVYRHDPERSGFRIVSRYSDNPEYDKPSERSFYPDDEGVIGEAWARGHNVVAELPNPEEDLNEYLKLTEQVWKIKRDAAEQFTMKSCCYAAFPLKHPHGDEYGNIAVVVFESVQKGKLQIEKLKEEMYGAEGRRIAKFLVTMKIIEPRVDIASEEGV